MFSSGKKSHESATVCQKIAISARLGVPPNASLLARAPVQRPRNRSLISLAELALFSPPEVGAPRAQAPRLHGPRREAGAVSVFRSPGVGLFAPSQRGLSPRGNPRSRHRTRLEVAWDGPGPPDSAPDPSISLSILRSIFDILPWLRSGKKRAKGPPYFRVLLVRKGARCALAIAIRSLILSPPA